MTFYQPPPQLGNQFHDDALLRSYLRWRLPAQMLARVEPEFHRLGERAVSDIHAMGDAAEAQPPVHVPYDAWGRRTDDIVVSDAWHALDRVSAEEGLVAIAYERKDGALSRVDQMARMYLFHPASATYSCPLAMTDGAARLLELHGGEADRRAFDHLVSRDPSRFWTSGQWMTERTGGSDVSMTSTIARRTSDGFALSGTKWFTSATTSQMAITLARIEGAPSGSKGLSVFLIELRDDAGALRGIQVNRLKDKLGTRALPTAELTLTDTPAQLVGGEGDGVRKIATMLNVTRAYNAVAAIGGMRRALALARDYATRRRAFGKTLAEQPLHAETLADVEARVRACFHLTFQVVELLGREETGTASEADLAMLRLLTPVAKLYTAKQAVAVASEVIESFGGAGYVEDTGLPRLLRDAQVLPIWEGTTNVLSLDVLRAIARSDALSPWLAHTRSALATITDPDLVPAVRRTFAVLDHLEMHVSAESDDAAREAGARRLAFAIARVASATRMLEHAQWTVATGDADADARPMAMRWANTLSVEGPERL